MNGTIKKIVFLYQNQPARRKIKVILTSGNVVYIEKCYESWQQYGGTQDELWETMPIAKKYNGWLHGD